MRPNPPSAARQSIPFKMNQISSLAGSHLRTYTAIFQHPVSHNLEWREVRALFEHIAEVVEQPNGNLRVTRHGESLVLHPPRTKDVAEIEELMAIRHFIQRSEQAAPATAGGEPHWLVVINHHEARIYRSETRDSVPERVLPHAPDEFFRHAPHSRDFARGQEKPDPNSYFEPVARALQGNGPILLFGSGTGTASEMDQFASWLHDRHPAVAQRIIESCVVDEHHLTEAQLLAKARGIFATAPRATPPPAAVAAT
jgi:hypothetical protein